MRAVFTILGVVLLCAGTLFALQGAGVVMWPASSFMLQQQGWVTNGVALALLGVVFIVLGRRRPR